VRLSAASISKRIRLRIYGIVQGVGFRPFVYKKAIENRLSGFVFNDTQGVVVEIEGALKDIDFFIDLLQKEAPPLSCIEKIEQHECELQGDTSFFIKDSNDGEVNTSIPVDVSLCDDCLREMQDPKDRRYNYPFINCTNCGVRYTIIKELPYDRKNTSMVSFTMCRLCAQEYNDPKSRRYHAEPISCFECGPKLELIEDGKYFYKDVISRIVKLLREGAVIAIKGVGGFHIVCDATNNNALEKLRTKKQRVSKPFAVMFDSIEEVKKLAIVSDEEEKILYSVERPIVLLQKKKHYSLSELVAPNINYIGAFLPYTPLHKLLLEALKRPLVVTSANKSQAPIITDLKEVQKEFGDVVCAIVNHDREIVNACDDSVVTVLDERLLFYRLARGYGPKSFFLSKTLSKKILAVGANQKNSIAIAFGNQILLSAHIGDLDSLDAFEYFTATLQSFERIYNFKPDIIVCDKHPRYETHIWAKEYVKKYNDVKLIALQHHYAHALAVMAEYGLEEEVLAFCFDGTGYGEDGTLWGGEVLLACVNDYKRVGHLQEIKLLGGEKAVKEPRRVGLALLFKIFPLEEILMMTHPLVKSFTQVEIVTLYKMYEKNLNAPKSSSIGRLFDGVYALCGFTKKLGYEGESGLILEKLAKESDAKYGYSVSFRDGEFFYEDMIREMLSENSIEDIAKRFLLTLVDIMLLFAYKYKKNAVVVCGGVFQNKTLLEYTKAAFNKANKVLYIPAETAINDGSISLGQAYWAIKNTKKDNNE
jgi:hydrogenase maturation protein HypF